MRTDDDQPGTGEEAPTGSTRDVDTDDSLRPRSGGGQEAHWQEAAAGEIGQGGEQVTGTLGSSGAGMGANTTEQVDRSRDRYSDITQS